MGGKHGIGIPTLPRFQTGSLEAPSVASTFVPGAERPMDATAKQRRMEQAHGAGTSNIGGDERSENVS